MYKYVKGIQRMILFIDKLFADVKRNGFYFKPSSRHLLHAFLYSELYIFN